MLPHGRQTQFACKHGKEIKRVLLWMWYVSVCLVGRGERTCVCPEVIKADRNSVCVEAVKMKRRVMVTLCVSLYLHHRLISGVSLKTRLNIYLCISGARVQRKREELKRLVIISTFVYFSLSLFLSLCVCQIDTHTVSICLCR